MKTLCYMMALCLLLPFAVHAGSAPAKKQPKNQFRVIDQNRDGFIGLEEQEQYTKEVFKELDVNGDNAIDKGECAYGCVVFKPGRMNDAEKQGREQTLARSVTKHFGAMDKDGDEHISLDELLAYERDGFQKRDKNKDGKLSKPEFGARVGK